MLTFFYASRCTTCKRARDFLDRREISYEERDIAAENPTAEEINDWLDRTGIEVEKLFGSGDPRFREKNLRARIPTLTREEAVEILASDGMLLRRPVLVGDDFILFGFKESEWTEHLDP